MKLFNKIYAIPVLIVLLLSNTKVKAQTEPMYSQYMYNMLSINPAYAGSREVLSMNMFHRKQWVGIAGAPQTTSLTIDQSFNDKKVGLGIQMYDDRLGVEKAQGVNAMWSARVRISENGILSGGLQFGVMNYRADLTKVENRFTPGDPAFSQNYSKWLPSVGMGLFYNTDKFYMGVSVPNLMRTRLATFDLIKSGIQNVNDLHFFATAGYVYDINDQVKFKPSAMVKVVSGAPIQYDFNANFWLKELIGFGVSYRTKDAVLGMIELQTNRNFRIGYAYDIPVSDLKLYTQGTHEIMLRYEFSKDKTNIKSTRYF
jgi:type IX secretion system PorP/SprF family membrane protein